MAKYQTLKRQSEEGAQVERFAAACPHCGFENQVTLAAGRPAVSTTCEHVVRHWRVAADGRVRVELREPAMAGAGS